MQHNKLSANVVKEINNLITYVIEKGICDTPLFPSINNEAIGFKNNNFLFTSLKENNYNKIYQQIRENGLFNILFLDGALLQFMYMFDKNKLIKHRLAFYPSPILDSFQENSECYMNDDLYIEIIQRQIIPFPIRFDFDISAFQDIRHPKSHLTLGDVEGCRIPISAPLTPYSFLKFILSHFYRTDKYDFVTDMPKSILKFNNTISDNEKLTIHMISPY